MNFGEVLKELRAERGITQEKLARDLDIPESSIRRLETSDGVPRKERIKQISSYFGVSTDRLLGNEIDQTSIEETKKAHALETIDKAIFDEFMKLDPKKKDKLRRIMEIVKEE